MEVLDLQKKVYIRNGAKYSKVSAFWYLLVQCSVCGQITIYNSQCMANLTLCSDMTFMCIIRESVDSLCRDGADTPRPPYIGNACARPNATFVSLFSRLTVVLK